MNCGCHCCREYCAEEHERHHKRDLIVAWHYMDGKYSWSKDRPKGGRRVRICKECRDFALTE